MKKDIKVIGTKRAVKAQKSVKAVGKSKAAEKKVEKPAVKKTTASKKAQVMSEPVEDEKPKKKPHTKKPSNPAVKLDEKAPDKALNEKPVKEKAPVKENDDAKLVKKGVKSEPSTSKVEKLDKRTLNKKAKDFYNKTNCDLLYLMAKEGRKDSNISILVDIAEGLYPKYRELEKLDFSVVDSVKDTILKDVVTGGYVRKLNDGVAVTFEFTLVDADIDIIVKVNATKYGIAIREYWNDED